MAFNIVEHIQELGADCAFDQPCKFGHRVEGHAVYCHNDAWENGPRKCRRTWYTSGEIKDEDCPGFESNTEFKGAFNPTPITTPLCSKCGGARLTATDGGKKETCPHCEGDGYEPSAIEMSQYEQDTLEMGQILGGRHPGDRFVRIAESDIERNAVMRLCDLRLVILRAISWTGNAAVYLLETTGKGVAVMKANWAAKEKASP